MRWDDIHIDDTKLAGHLASFCFASRDIIARYFRSNIAIEGKSDDSPVTIADRQAEAAIRQAIKEAYPDHNILGEEGGGIVTNALDWVIDPIDGTRVFISGKPLFGTLIALCHQGEAIASVIDMPLLDEMFIGIKGQKSTLNGKPIAVSGITDLSRARIASTAPEALDDKALESYLGLTKRALSSNWGGDCYNYALLAAGHTDIVIEHQLASHDIMGLVPVIESAGGIITDWDGAPVRLGHSTSVIASASPALHQAALEAMGSAR